MTSKTLQKQLMAAIAMVLVAAVALGSSTYAWFANNNRVTAEGISITAQSEGKLLVIDTTASFTTTNTSATMAKNEAGSKLYPTHPIYTASAVSEWKHNTSDSYTIAIHGTTTEATVTNATTADGKYYYFSDELYIHLDGTDSSITASDLILSGITVTATGGTKADKSLQDSLRVLLLTTDSNGTSKTVNVYKADGSHVTTDISADGNTALVTEALGTNDPVIASTIKTNADVKVQVYIYFDGRDTNCTSANFDTDNLAVALQFDATI